MEHDSCDFWPDGGWAACCDAHDLAYQEVSWEVFRWLADVQLFACVVTVDPLNAIAMYVGVAVAGWFAFKRAVLGGRTFWELITGKPYVNPKNAPEDQ